MAERLGPSERPRAAHPDDGANRAAAEDVAALLRDAGRREAVPAADLAAIREAFRAEWEQALAARRRRRLDLLGVWLRPAGGPRFALLAATSALLALLSLGIWWSSRRPDAPEVLALVETLAGSATVSGASAPLALREGMAIEQGAWIETPGLGGSAPASRVGLRLAAASLRIDAGSRVRLRRRDVVELASGAVYVDSEQLARQVEVRTPRATVRDIGTQFEVRLLRDGAGGLRVRVRRGEVAVVQTGRTHGVVAGEELELDAAGAAFRAAVPRYGSEWSWVLGVAPPFELEGRSTRDLLDWIARETGWEVRYADAATEAAAAVPFVGAEAATVRTPGEVALRWLEAAGLAARLDDGSLLVSRLPR
jgi:hypothetical protein